MNQIREILHLLDPIANITTLNKLDKHEKLSIIEQKTTIKPSQIILVIVLGLLLFGLSYFMRLSELFVWFICYFFPAYFALKSLMNHDNESCTRYLVYWILFPILGWSYPLFKMMLNRTFFAGFRVVLTFILLYPKLNIAGKLYNDIIRPFLQNHGKSFSQGIDHAISQGQQLIQNVAGKIKAKKEQKTN